MPWYFMTFDFGPGHQSHDEGYHWSDEVLKGEDRKAFWEDCAPSYSDSVIGKMRLVKKLPNNVWEEKMSYYKGSIKYYRKRIKGLKETEILKNCRVDKYGQRKVGKKK